jgi:hypothetical protein
LADRKDDRAGGRGCIARSPAILIDPARAGRDEIKSAGG